MKSCPKHGELAPADIYTRSNGETECRLCGREAMKRHRRKQGKRTYKQHLAEVRGEPMPLAAIAPRQKRRRSDALLTRRQVHAAYELHKGGWTIPQVSEHIWEKHGFVSMESCRESLYEAFKLDGLKVDLAQSMRMLYAQRGCKGCGGPTDGQTPGCQPCNSRAWYRRQAA